MLEAQGIRKELGGITVTLQSLVILFVEREKNKSLNLNGKESPN
jgi:hypothetical protein